MYSTHNKGKSVVAERSIRTLENKVYKHMTSISKNAYIDIFDGKVNKYNDTYSTTKTKPVDVSQAHILILIKRIIKKIKNLNPVIM